MHNNPIAFFRNQVVFLTGATGSLGGCLLFKLALKVDTHKIYVLVRGSAAKAITRWTENMPMQIGDILATKKVHFVVGDIGQKDFGIDPAILAEMAKCVTVIVHGAANITLKAP